MKKAKTYRWTREEEDKLLKIMKDNMTYAQMGEIMGRTPLAIKYKMKQLMMRKDGTH